VHFRHGRFVRHSFWTGKSLGDIFREVVRTRANLALIRVSVEAACDRLGVPDVAPFILAEISSTLREIEAAESADLSAAPRRSARRNEETARRQLAGLDSTIERNFARLEGKYREPAPDPLGPEAKKQLVRIIARPGARRLVNNFLSLPTDERMRIAGALGLLQDDDPTASEIELYKILFTRAKERGLLDRLTELVEMSNGRSA
jgi:hypothetical protein